MSDFTTSGFFVLRTPLFPFEEFQALSQDLATFAVLDKIKDEELAPAIEADRRLVRSRLQQFVRRPEVQEALWIAAPEFSQTLAAWWSSPESKKGQKLEQSLYRYVARMTSRPTPFGLFAGCSVGRIGNETRLAIEARGSYWRRSRLDMEYLCNLAEKVVADPELRQRIMFHPNTSLYLAAGRYHHVQGYFIKEARAYRLIATDFTPYLAATLQRAASGATPAALAAALVEDDPDIALTEAQVYIGQLIESQILVSNLVPPITGPEPIDHMLAQLERAGASSLTAALSTVSGHLQSLDEKRLGNEPAAYQPMVAAIAQLPASYKLEHLIQVDMMKASPHASLSQRFIEEILRALETLHSIRAAPQQTWFKQFKDDFRERYQDQEVPLMLALDEEVGIGFERKDRPSSMAEPLLEDLPLGAADESDASEEIRGSNSESILLRKVEELAREKKTVLELDAALLKSLKVENPLPLPDAFSVMGIVAGRPEAKKLSFIVQGASGPSGANLLGRFCHADPELTAFVQEHLRAEEQLRKSHNAVLAEIAHLPEGRIGNVLFRPILRQHEIPYLATSCLPPEQQIPVTDLMVSLRNDRIVLRSQRLDREVLPRLTSAHGYAHGRNLKLYKFLCLLQMQGVTGGISWHWGMLDHLSFLPRVTFGNVVFALARWRLEKELVEGFAKLHGPERLRQVHEWRTRQGIPRFALLTEADNQLLIDFENVLSVETFVDYAKRRPGARLVEMFPAPDELCAHGPEGSFTHEVVVPLVRKQPLQPANVQKQQTPAATSAQRNFLPGSEWLFAKIYGSPSHLDRFLIEGIKPLVESVLAAGEADSWFFIRYGDPQWHLRLRLHGDPKTLSAQVLPRLWEAVNAQVNQEKAIRMQLDTYEREIERYGGPEGITIAERLFQADSELALALLASIAERPGPGSNLRWQIACASVDRLLAGLGFSLDARRHLLNNMGKAQEKSFSVGQEYRKQLSERFRKERPTLEKILSNPAEVSEFPASVHSSLAQFAAKVQPIREQLEQARLANSLTELAGSYVHMHLNRIFRSTPNAQEMVLYDFLTRTYDSVLARKKREAASDANQRENDANYKKQNLTTDDTDQTD